MMKKIYFILITLIVLCGCNKNIIATRGLKFKLPAQADEISTSVADSIIEKVFNIPTTGVVKSYTIDDLVITYYHRPLTQQDDTFEGRVLSNHSVYMRQPKSISSEYMGHYTKTENGIKYAVFSIKYIRPGRDESYEKFITFYTGSTLHNINLFYAKADSTKAEKVLNYIVKSLKPKN